MIASFTRRAIPRALATATTVTLVALGSPAVAAPPKLTLPSGSINLALNLEIEATTGALGRPTSIAPDASFGITDDVTVSVVHSTFMVTGFRGAAGRGLCVTGSSDGCAHLYNNVGAEGLFNLVGGGLAIAANAGIHATNLDAGFYAAKLGFKLRSVTGPVVVTGSPSLYLALAKRDAMPRNKDFVFVPLSAIYKLPPAIGVGMVTGVKGPVDGFSSAWEVSLGALATYAVSPRLGFGASWVFGKAIGGADDPPDPAPGATGLRYRAIQVWATITR